MVKSFTSRKSSEPAARDSRIPAPKAASMTKKTSRRDFLELSAMGLGATVLPRRKGTTATLTEASDASPAGSEISVWVTAGDERFAAAPEVNWGASSGEATGETIQLDPSKKYQDILGFGGAFTDAACYMLHQLAPAAREQLIHEMFHPSEMGLNVCRTCIGASDYSASLYSFDDGAADPDLTRFSIEHDREYILPVLREARKQNPDLFLFSSPWSPPGWMKFNGTMLGGSMRNHYLPTYAQYMLKFLQGYAAEGIPIQAVTSQNEVDTDQDGRMPACSWPQEYEIEFVGKHLGPLLERSGVPTKIWLLDHNYNLWGRVMGELEDDAVRKYADGIAWHGYVGTPEMMSKVHEAYPDARMHWTEGGPAYTAPDYQTDWCRWGETYTSVLRNWCRSITAWNLALDERGKPNIGPFDCGGMVTIHSQTKEITRSGQYWGFAHFSRLVRRGARRFDSQSTSKDIQHVGMENTDGRRVLVLTNGGHARTVELLLANRTAQIPLKASSLTTLAWQ
jgi:glucosylceramidase